MKNINENLLMRPLKSNRLQLTSALAEDWSKQYSNDYREEELCPIS